MGSIRGVPPPPLLPAIPPTYIPIYGNALCRPFFYYYLLSQEVERLNEASKAQAAGVKGMLEESRARESDAAARIQLLKASSAHEVSLAKEEVRVKI